MDIILTNNADKVICIIYKVYLERIKSGESKRSAVNFINLKELHDKNGLKEVTDFVAKFL